MFDLKTTTSGDLFIDAVGDVATTESIVQAVTIRLRWFANEWRLGQGLGFPYFEDVLVKNPNIVKIKYLLRDEIMSVDGVTGVEQIDIDVDKKTRQAHISVIFTVGEETYKEEVNINA